MAESGRLAFLKAARTTKRLLIFKKAVDSRRPPQSRTRAGLNRGMGSPPSARYSTYMRSLRNFSCARRRSISCGIPGGATMTQMGLSSNLCSSLNLVAPASERFTWTYNSCLPQRFVVATISIPLASSSRVAFRMCSTKSGGLSWSARSTRSSAFSPCLRAPAGVRVRLSRRKYLRPMTNLRKVRNGHH